MKRRISLALLLPAILLLQGCVEVAAVGIGAAAVTVMDRRTTGTLIEDEGIELRATNRVGERYGDKVHVNVTSYNRTVLLTGEVADAGVREEIEKIASATPHVRGVINEIQVGKPASLQARANDAGITGKVKARFLDANKFSPLHVKVVTEAGVVYLMGIVNETEANDAVEVARTTGGVRKVVRVFEYCKATDPACRSDKK